MGILQPIKEFHLITNMHIHPSHVLFTHLSRPVMSARIDLMIPLLGSQVPPLLRRDLNYRPVHMVQQL